MIKVRLVYQHDGTFPETHYWCPACKDRSRFYSVPHTKCPLCWYEDLPNIRNLKEKVEARVTYHWGKLI